MKKKLKSRKKMSLVPRMDWQTGEYSRQANFKFTLPYQFLLLCKILDVTPEEIVRDFMNNLSHGSWKNEGREGARGKLTEYFIEQGYGRSRCSENELRQMFGELEAIGLLFPKEADSILMDIHAGWLDAYHQYWFTKWNGRINAGQIPARSPA